MASISYPLCEKGIRPGVCKKPAISHKANRLYPFFTKRVTNLSSAPLLRHTCIVGNGQISQWDLMGKINKLQSWDKNYVHLYTTQCSKEVYQVWMENLNDLSQRKWKKRLPNSSPTDYIHVYNNRDFPQTWRRSNDNDFSYECVTYQPKSILITFCHLYFHIYNMLVDHNVQIVS